jgi:hypothetical protein
MARDRDVVGRVGKDHLCPLAAEQRLIGFSPRRIAADQPVLANLPDITGPGDGRPSNGVDDLIGVAAIVWVKLAKQPS